MLLLPILAAVAPAVAQPARGVVVGRVFGADGRPLAGAVVRLFPARDAADSGVVAAQTDTLGRFTLRGVRAGLVRLEVRRLGYASRVVADVVVQAARPAEVRVVLEPLAATLAGVRVRPSYFPGVRGPATPVSTVAFTTEELRRVPGAQEDVLRSLSVLPGVSATTEQRNDLAVRGGQPVETLFVVDGLEVPNLDHFGTQGSTGGATSIIPTDFVREGALSAGGFGARYGDRASAVVDLALRDGSRERLGGQLFVSSVLAGASAEGPLGATGSFLAGARVSFLGPVFRWLGADFGPNCGDGTLKVPERPAARDEVLWCASGGRSTVHPGAATARERYGNRDVIAPNETQYFTGLTWRRRLTRGAASVTVGRTSSEFATEQRGPFDYYSPSQLLFRAHTAEGEEQLRATLAWSPGADPAAATVEVGAVAKYADRLHYNVFLPGVLRRDADGFPHPLDLDTTFTAFRAGSYAQVDARVAPHVRAAVGVRGDYYAFDGDALRVAPRASVTWTPDEEGAVTLAGGRYWQAPQPIWLVGAASNRPSAAGGGVRPFRADHLVFGIERTPRPDVRVRVEAYAKWYGDYPARVFRPGAVLQLSGYANALSDIPFGLEPLASTGTGRVRGVELLVEKKPSDVPVYGLASIAFTGSRFTGLSGEAVPGVFDAPVSATAVAAWRPGMRWELSTRARAATGGPTTPYDTSGTFYGELDPTRYYQGPRRTRFVSVDVRAERRFTWRSGRLLVAYVDVQNVANRRNWTDEEWSQYRQAPFRITTIGRLPSVGVSWAF